MDEKRRARFLAWYAQRFGSSENGRQEFIAETGRHGFPAITKGRASQYFDAGQPFGERAARSLAERLGLDPSAFLVETDAAQRVDWMSTAWEVATFCEDPELREELFDFCSRVAIAMREKKKAQDERARLHTP